MPDLRVEPERRLDRIAFEPVVEQVARAAGHELPQVALRGAGEPGELSAKPERMQPVAPAPAEVGGVLRTRSRSVSAAVSIVR